jgi:phosphoserine aminotransferase
MKVPDHFRILFTHGGGS